MSHEITSKDGLVLQGKKAWHGLGTVVRKSITPLDALRFANLNWKPLEVPLIGDGPEGYTHIKTHKAIVRSDDRNVVLGVVGNGYTPISNFQLADMCYTVTEEWRKKTGKQLTVETAGSIFEGRKVWFLLKANPFEVSKNDIVEQYTLASNGFDGKTALSFLPTNIRVVCNNTFTRATKNNAGAGFTLRHTPNVDERLKQLLATLDKTSESLEIMRKDSCRLNSVGLDKSQTQTYFINAYQEVFKTKQDRYPLPVNPVTDRENRMFERAMNTINSWALLQEEELETHSLDRTAWTAYNAVSKWFDHEKKIKKVKGESSTEDRRIKTNLFGRSARSKQAAFNVALQQASLLSN